MKTVNDEVIEFLKSLSDPDNWDFCIEMLNSYTTWAGDGGHPRDVAKGLLLKLQGNIDNRQ